MKIIIEKSKRLLTLYKHQSAVFRVPVALGKDPIGPKIQEGDGKTPEGSYRICIIKENGKYGRSLGLSYPSEKDAIQAFEHGRIDASTLAAIQSAHTENRRPPWGTPLGGEIYIHEGGSHADWTQGCIALDSESMDKLWPYRSLIEQVEITE